MKLLFLGLTSAIWDPLATKFELIKTDIDELSVETDFNLGFEARHKPKSSEYQELRDEFITSINFKQWAKINIRIHDTFVHSNVIEWTWFDL